MESIAQEVAQKQYLEQVYMHFIKDKKLFQKEVYCKAVSQIAAGVVNLEIEMMNLSDLAFKRFLEINETDKNRNNWNELSFVLRKMAQEIYNKHGLTDDTRFLKLVS